MERKLAGLLHAFNTWTDAATVVNSAAVIALKPLIRVVSASPGSPKGLSKLWADIDRGRPKCSSTKY